MHFISRLRVRSLYWKVVCCVFADARFSVHGVLCLFRVVYMVFLQLCVSFGEGLGCWRGSLWLLSGFMFLVQSVVSVNLGSEV